MSHTFHHPITVIYINNIRHNHQQMLQHAAGQAQPPNTARPWPLLLPVVKADAYGHGYARVAKALVQEGAGAFASGSLPEAAALRNCLAPHGQPAIVSLLGALQECECTLAQEHNLVATLHSLEQLAVYISARKPLNIAIKCNSGMGRLGFSLAALPELAHQLKQAPWLNPVLALSHLATADEPGGEAEALHQATRFGEALGILRAHWPHMQASLGNSAGLFMHSALSRAIGPHACRPGLALYGISPLHDATIAPGPSLRPAMAMRAPVLALRTLHKGEGTGYGLTFTAPHEMRVAFIGIGYSHGYPRQLSAKGHVCIHGIKCPIVGRISMQMTTVDVSAVPSLGLGDPAWVMGGPFAAAPTATELAAACNTIPYELLCLLGKNTHEYHE
ncbi:alanine racemase [Desulfovibrio cuneatus]|uniref:alanine racemase n=1 Tax=Desulfovibrio cuneatus TaxID=159728 RepID=UPI0004282D81|nr:alanine racemase [Desulfovibrio cuneatus]